MIYDAFISYRHAPLDMEVAKKLHRSLESYHIPAAVQKRTGKKKINRVFRDQEELPIGSDLDDKISSALMESEYLIVVCSPETPGSYWVCKEIETFIRMHDREHVLAVLIDGEPSESFPPQILVDDRGNPIEPLAADIRGSNPGERNKKFKTEFLRLAAPLIGCSYDDLRQRHRERVIRKTIMYVSAAMLLIAGAGIAFGIYQSVVAKQMEELAEERTELAENMTQLATEKSQLAADILEEYRDKQINQSRFYASAALSLLESGDRRAAALVAAEGLPSEKDERPYVPEAEYALSKALYAYSKGTKLEYDRLLNHDLNLTSCHMNGDGTRLMSVDIGNNVYVWDCSDWSLMVKIPPKMDENGSLSLITGADMDDDYVYISDSSEFRKYDLNGDLIYTLPYEDLHTISILGKEGIAFIVMPDHIEQIELSDGKMIRRYENTVDSLFGDKTFYSEEYACFLCTHFDPDDGNAYISLIDPYSDEVKNVLLSSDHIFRFCLCDDGNIAVVSGDKDFLMKAELSGLVLDLISPSGELLWSSQIDLSLRNYADLLINVRAHSFSEDGIGRSTIVVTIKENEFSFNEADGSCILKTNLPATATKLILNDDNPRGFVVFNNGDITLMDFENGKIYQENSMHFDLYMWDLISANGNIVIQTRFDDDLHVLSYHKASDLEELTKCDESMTINAVSPAGDYFIMYSSKDGYVFYDMDAKPFYTFREDQGDYLVCFSFDGPVVNAFCSKALYIIDPVEKKTEKISYQEMGIDFNISAVNVSDNKKFATLLQGKFLYYVDCEKQSCIKKYTADTTIAGVITENDGQHVYVSEYGNSLYELDINTLDKRGFFSEEIMPVKDILNYDILKISPDHTMLAMLCGDYQLRILDIKTGELISIFPAKFRSFAYLNFSKDNRYIYIQTDDFVFRIWDIKNGKFVCCCDTINAMFKYEMYDENSNRVAFGNSYDLYVFDTENNGMVAEISDGIAYMANNSFILYKNRQLYRTYYKDYRKLLEEIGKQFTDTELSQEERVRYNIN